MDADERARAGIFLAFQYPVAIRGITNAYFLQSAINARRKEQGLEELDTLDFAELLEGKLEELGWDDSLIHRAVNDGFSGGEKKRNEIIQLAMLEPRLAILDETDSGLDIDAVKAVSDAVNKFRSPDRAFVMVTHYERILNYVTPDYVHVLARGKVLMSGDMELALKLEAEGYDWVTEAAGVA
jgi:Fe-S cluster assembly ATP-binding protein